MASASTTSRCCAADGAQELLRGHALPEPTTLGRFLRRFTLGHIGQLNRALDQLFARVDPLLGREAVTLDLDASYVEHHGPVGSRQGTRGTDKGKVAWHPLLCFVGETGEWLHAKLRNGHAAASTGAIRFLGECLRRLPAGVRLFLRADEGFYGKDFLAELEQYGITYTVGAMLNNALRERISAVAAADWLPSSYREGSEVASFVWQPKTWKQSRRFVVRRDPAEPGEQLALDEGAWHYWAFVTNDSERSADELESWHRAKASVENRIKEAKLDAAATARRLVHTIAGEVVELGAQEVARGELLVPRRRHLVAVEPDAELTRRLRRRQFSL